MSEFRAMAPILTSLLLLAAVPAQGPESVEAEEAARRLRACGLPEVSVRYDADIRDSVLLVGDSSPADEALACAADVAITTGYWVAVLEGSQASYFAHYSRVSRERSREWARTRLSERGLLENVPDYVEGESDDRAMADRLEDLCGAAAEGALQSEYGPHAIGPSWAVASDRSFAQTGEVLMCLMTYAAAAGFDLGFIGNEKATEAK